MALGAILSVGGKLVQGIGGYVAGIKQKHALDAQAENVGDAGVAQELQLRDSARQATGQQVSAQFSNGFMGGSGSAIDALHQSQVNSALDVLNLRRQWSSKVASLRYQGEQAKAAGTSALVGSLFKAGGAVTDWASARGGNIPDPTINGVSGSDFASGVGDEVSSWGAG